MASVELQIAGRRYAIACRDGEEQHLRAVAAIVDGKAAEATSALGNMGESRHLLFTTLLLADELKERREGGAPAASAVPAGEDEGLAAALERLADRLEALAARASAT